jgi:hypothetical protein
MPLRNERQAYWDDIEQHITDVQPLTGTGALAKLCPDAAAHRDALKSRLASVTEAMAAVERQRVRNDAEARVVRNEDEARDFLQEKDARHKHAAQFVRGRLENDRLEARGGWGGGRAFTRASR